MISRGKLKLHMIFYACNCMGQVGQSGESKEKQMEIRKRILNSQELKEAFCKVFISKRMVMEIKTTSDANETQVEEALFYTDWIEERNNV